MKLLESESGETEVVFYIVICFDFVSLCVDEVRGFGFIKGFRSLTWVGGGYLYLQHS